MSYIFVQSVIVDTVSVFNVNWSINNNSLIAKLVYLYMSEIAIVVQEHKRCEFYLEGMNYNLLIFSFLRFGTQEKARWVSPLNMQRLQKIGGKVGTECLSGKRRVLTLNSQVPCAYPAKFGI